MFLESVIERNPALIEAAVRFHRQGRIPPNSYVIDLDTVEDNAISLRDAARRHGLQLYVMSKQYGRNPLVTKVVVETGLGSIVAVSMEEAKWLAQYDLPIGHIGHLVQVPTAAVERALAMEADVVTVFSPEKALQIARAARSRNAHQRLLLRVVGESDWFYPGQKGGIPLAELAETVEKIGGEEGISVAGITSFPCLRFDEEQESVQPTTNLQTLRRAAEELRRNGGMGPVQINAPGLTCVRSMPILARHGVTHGEPGSSLTGQTPLHAVSREEEVPAMIYLSEVSHWDSKAVYTFGGGFYPRGRIRQGLHVSSAGGDRQGDRRIRYPAEPLPPQAIDYYGSLRRELPDRGEAEDPSPVRLGDPVIYAFRAQVFTSRARVAVVGGLRENAPELYGLFTASGTFLDEDGGVLPSVEAKDRIGEILARREAARRRGNSGA